jgi:hypothetical protein
MADVASSHLIGVGSGVRHEDGGRYAADVSRRDVPLSPLRLGSSYRKEMVSCQNVWGCDDRVGGFC